MQRLTREQVESRKEKAVRFTDNVLGDPDRADEIAEESVEDYAERKGIEIAFNPERRKRRLTAMTRTTKTKADLEQEVEDLTRENEDLQDQLDAVADIIAPSDDDEEDIEDEDEENEAQD